MHSKSTQWNDTQLFQLGNSRPLLLRWPAPCQPAEGIKKRYLAPRSLGDLPLLVKEGGEQFLCYLLVPELQTLRGDAFRLKHLGLWQDLSAKLKLYFAFCTHRVVLDRVVRACIKMASTGLVHGGYSFICGIILKIRGMKK